MTTTIVQNSFLPTQISGCQLWLDAADSSTITGTSPVTAWRDKSGTGRTVTFTGTNTYTSSPASVNTNIASSYFSADVDVRKTTVLNLSIFLVYKWNSYAAGTNQFLWGGDVGGGWNRIQILTFPIGNQFSYGLAVGGSSPYATPVAGLNNGNLLLYNANYAYGVTNGTYANVNGSLATSLETEIAASSQTSYSGVNFGNGNGDITYASSDSFSEIIIYYGTLTTAQRQQVEGYLAQKWGLQASLPSNHPYKYSAYFTNLGYVSTILSPVNTNKITNAAFLPTQITGCQQWFDAADPNGNGVVPANGATLSTWIDKSGNGRNATVAGGKIAGTYSTANKAVYFAASNTGYVTSYTANPSLETMFVVFNNPSPSGNNNMVIGGPQGARSLSGGYGGGGAGVGAVSYLNDLVTWVGMASMPAGSYTSGTTVIITGQVNGLTTSISQNGGTIYSNTTTSPFSNVTTYLGTDYGSPNQYYIGYEMEIIFYNSLLALSQRQQVEGYLAWKWGLQGSLAPTHPYKYTSAVFVTQPRALTILGANPYNNTMVSRYFNPTSIAGTQLWLDAADQSAITFTSGTTVSLWKDKSGNGNNGTPNTGVTWAANGFGTNLPAMTYTTTQWFTGNISITGDQLTAFSVFNMSSSSQTYPRVISLGAPGASAYNNNSYMITVALGGSTQFVNYRNNVTTPTSFNISFNTNELTSSWVDGRNSYLSQYGGTPVSTGSSNNFNVSSYAIGTDTDTSATTHFYGYISEIIVYNIALTTAQRQQVEGYLAWKWRLQANLPPTHPYKGYPPPP